MKVSILFFILLLVFTLSKKFQFNKHGEFTILQITDLHYGENLLADALTLNLQRKLLQTVQPDIVIITGDALSGNFWLLYGGEEGFFKENWEKWTLPFTEYETYYAYLLGNHDDEADLNRRQIMELDMTHPFSVSQISEEEMSGASTYSIPVYSSKNSSKASANLWILDSGREGCDDVKEGYGCIERDQVDWYNRESTKFKELHGENAHHLAFFHIPIPEFMNLYNSKPFYGKKEEPIGCSAANTEFFDAVVKNKDITAMFVGHDHVNDYGGWLNGVELIYGRKTGYGSYGPGLGIQKGARVIKLKEITKENGDIVVVREHYIAHADGTYDYNKTTQKRDEGVQKFCISPSSYQENHRRPKPFTSTFPEYDLPSIMILILQTYSIIVGCWLVTKLVKQRKGKLEEVKAFANTLEL